MDTHVIGGITLGGKVIVTISKCDNGYIVNLIEPPKFQKKQAPKNLDEEVDGLIDGIVALNKHMEGTPGEEWREGNAADRKRIREAFKKTHPGLMHQFEPCPEPRVEQKVFATKEDLFDYLKKNL